jgi:hypothetical protein
VCGGDWEGERVSRMCAAIVKGSADCRCGGVDLRDFGRVVRGLWRFA